jgi:hypothetical protein
VLVPCVQRLTIYFHLICHLILTKIYCITLKIRSKADFKSKLQNIWQQIILFSSTVNSIFFKDYPSYFVSNYSIVLVPCVQRLTMQTRVRWHGWTVLWKVMGNISITCLIFFIQYCKMISVCGSNVGKRTFQLAIWEPFKMLKIVVGGR